MGGFDITLGPPTPTLAGEDIEALLRVMLSGSAVVHEPAALVWHAHPREYQMLRRRMWGYGLGLSACVTRSVVANPSLLPTLLRKMPRGIAFALSPKSDKNEKRQGDYPKELIWLELAGLACGPFAYGRSRWQHRGKGDGLAPSRTPSVP
jgi:O-antigen biosynthesis protein